MKKILLVCILFGSPVHSSKSTEQVAQILNEDSDTIIKYAIIGILTDNIQLKQNLANQKTVQNIKSVVETLKYASLKEANNKLSGSLDELIKTIEELAINKPDLFIMHVINGKRIAG